MGHTDKHQAKHGVGQEDDVHPTLDHGNVQGLSDDDHSQYLLENGTRALSGEMALGSNKLTGGADGATGTQDISTVKQMEDYVSATVQAMVSKDNVIAGTTEALPANTRTADVLTADANGEFPTIDAVAPVLSQEYLVKDEGGGASHINDGIYTLTTLGDVGTPWALTRRADLDNGDSAAGAFLAVEQGTVNGDGTFRCINNTGTDIVNTDALEFKYWGATIDHGNLLGLNDDDHSQYHNNTRGDARYYTETELDNGQLDNQYFQESEHIDSSAGAGDAGKPIKLDAAGHVDSTMINDADVSHDNVADQRYTGAFALHLRADITSEHNVPEQDEFSAWAVGDAGFGIGLDSTIWLVRKTGAATIVMVQLT